MAEGFFQGSELERFRLHAGSLPTEFRANSLSAPGPSGADRLLARFCFFCFSFTSVRPR